MVNTNDKRSTKNARLPEKWRKLAQKRCDDLNERLTPARLGAYAELVASKQPLSAYELIAELENRQGRKIAPLTVYRHLDFLMRVGLVHRLESTQSYMPCNHPEHTHESQYLLCTSCSKAEEVESKQLEKGLGTIASNHGFRSDSAIVEIKGLCEACAFRAAN